MCKVKFSCTLGKVENMELQHAPSPAAELRKESANAVSSASEKMWIMPRRSEMVGWRERSCCALSGGRDEGERDGGGGEGASLRGLELGTDGAVLAIVQPSPSSSTTTRAR